MDRYRLNAVDLNKKPKMCLSLNDASNNYKSDQFHLLAVSCCAISLFSVLVMSISLPILCSQIDSERSIISAKSAKFKIDSNRVWTHLQSSTVNEARNKRSASVAEDVSRAVGSACGCSMLNCPQGPPGSAGAPGPDSPPGQPGNPGMLGEDGFDIVMEAELDFPCIVCPGGPSGQRGSQGERGMPGHAGPRGEEGISGKEGIPGPRGAVGARGNFGPKGQTGLDGIRGNQVVAGEGIKGPKGRQGPAGQMGPNGLPGSILGGQTGRTGEQGPTGQSGDMGRPGMPGDAGQSGEPGMPSEYCPSDCGVSHIKVTGLEQTETEENGGVVNKGTELKAELQNPHGRQQGTAATATEVMANGEANGGEIRRHPPTGGYEIRRHPTGGYYRQQLNGEK